MLLEVLAEEVAVRIAHLLSDLLDVVGRVGEATLRLTDAFAAQPINRTRAEGGLKDTREMGGTQAGETRERRYRVFLEIEELHLLDTAGEGRRDLRREFTGLLTGTVGLRDQFRHLGMNQRGRGRSVFGNEPEELLEDRRGFAQVHAGDDRCVADAEQIGQLRQTRPLGADPIHLPRIIRHCAVFMRMMAVDPDQVAAADLMRATGDTRPPLAA